MVQGGWDNQGGQTGRGSFLWGPTGCGGTRPVIQIPLRTCNNQPPIWRPAWGTERRLEAQPHLSLRFSEVPREAGGQRSKRVRATRTALTVPLLSSTSSKPWVLWLIEWLLRCWLGLWWAGAGGTALWTVSCVNSDFPGRGAVRIHAHNCPSEAAPQLWEEGDTQTQGQDAAEHDPGHGGSHGAGLGLGHLRNPQTSLASVPGNRWGRGEGFRNNEGKSLARCAWRMLPPPIIWVGQGKDTRQREPPQLAPPVL